MVFVCFSSSAYSSLLEALAAQNLRATSFTLTVVFTFLAFWPNSKVFTVS